MTQNKIKLGVFGFGCVGQGLHKVLNETHGIHAEIVRICIKDASKPRTISRELFTTRADDILDDPNINVVVELIDDAEEAFRIVKAAMKAGKSVVSANKKMISEHLKELYELQQSYDVPFLYEGAACASIPIIRNLEEYYDNDLLTSVEGVFNGSTNYILSQIFEHHKSFEAALKEAQEKGFAESDPTLDITGMDPAYKATIIILHTFGIFVDRDQVITQGIQHLNDFDIDFARKSGKVIKLLVKCGKRNDHVYSYCLPAVVDTNSPMESVHNEYNGLVLESRFSQKQVFIGKGAGSEPTGSAVVSDVSALSYNYRYEYKKTHQSNGTAINNDIFLKIYLRFRPYASIDLTRFRKIHEKFSNATGSYVIGEVNLKDLPYYQGIEQGNSNLLLLEELDN